jgi:hypothetical protein
MSLLQQLDALKSAYGVPKAAAQAEALLTKAQTARFRSVDEIVHLHESLLFLRAYPHNPNVLKLADTALANFGQRIDGRGDLAEFEYPEISGIAGTGLATNFSYPFASSLAFRHKDCVQVDWTQYTQPLRLAWSIAKLVPADMVSAAREDWAIAPHADWQQWYQKSGLTLERLIRNVTPEVYDLFELPIRWSLTDARSSRTHLRLARGVPRSKPFYHAKPLLSRKDVSLESAFAEPAIQASLLPHDVAQKVLDTIIDASAIRYRELYGFTYPDVDRMFHADLGRGVDFFFFGPPEEWRLPSREYCAGMYFKNGVPMGYVEVMWQNGRMEVGFNLYFTFRQGETAWLYTRLLKIFRERFEVDTFFIDPYQIGHENEEAIESGAFWFYYKLGFRPASPEIAKLAAREAGKVAAIAGYRTPPKTLRKLAVAPVEYRVE